MGMELIVSVAVQNHPERDTDDLLQILNHLKRGQALDIFEAVQGIAFEELIDDPDADPRDQVRAWVEEFIAAMNGDIYHRSIVFLDHPDLDKLMAIGGGDSWGDTPAGFDVVSAVAEWGEW